ncbi:MAG: hypothetical protein LBV67_10220 [Streptococcaceae bacterium]|jgi:GTP1/Obg family GTP-binding protein|nr:hypothetical protein [Streptococcaceae bacterium]
MDRNEQYQLEEEHARNIRKLDEAEGIIEQYRKQFYQKTSQLAEYVHRFYQELPIGFTRNFSGKFEQVFGEYTWQLKKKQQEIELAREEELRTFNQKMDF